VLGFIVTNKVGSPQYLVWLVPSLVAGSSCGARRGLRRRCSRFAAALTQLVYPVLYAGILTPAPLAVIVLTLRNLVLIALFVWIVARLVRVAIAPTPTPPGGPHADRLLRRAERFTERFTERIAEAGR
jgi:hypothetical protein